MKLESMSKNIVGTMITLSRNEMLRRLICVNDNPYDLTKPIPEYQEVINPSSEKARIHPYAFNAENSEEEVGVFVRVYYNDGDFNENEVIAESQLHVDIICHKDLWLINNGRESIIRPYDIAGRVIDLVGRRSIGTHSKLKFTGYQHLYINRKFECIRLYAEYMSVETQ